MLCRILAKPFQNWQSFCFFPLCGRESVAPRESVDWSSISLQARERFRNRDRQGAIDDYTQVLRYQPNNAEANFTRGLIYSGMDNRQNAIADLQRAAQLFREQGNENYYLIALEIIEDIQTRE